jgi:uncharacterized protein YbaP (TraB family)
MKRLLLVTFATVLGLIGCKQSAPPPEPAKVAPTAQASTGTADNAAPDPWQSAPKQKNPLARPLFWSIEKDGITSYALGTIHVGVDPEERLPQLVWDKLDAAPTFAMETDLADPALAKTLECIGCSLRRDLGEEHWKKLEEVLGKDVAARIDPMKPMVAATMMSLRGLPNTTQMDTILLGRAHSKKKKVVYLEPASHQAAMLEKWMNVKALKAMLDDVEGVERQTKQMLEAYIAGDDERMVALSEEEKKHSLESGYSEAEYTEQMEDMLYKRNASWIAPIEELHGAGGGFIAVGAMHLVGPRSVLEMLEQKGYKITRLAP